MPWKRKARQTAAEDPDIHILLLPPDAHRKINALQRAVDIILQKSIREGFGLTVTEAMWKGNPVIGGKAREFVRDNFLLTRHLREYLTLILSLHYGAKDKIELS